jgi:hypothetical protein
MLQFFYCNRRRAASFTGDMVKERPVNNSDMIDKCGRLEADDKWTASPVVLVFFLVDSRRRQREVLSSDCFGTHHSSPSEKLRSGRPSL